MKNNCGLFESRNILIVLLLFAFSLAGSYVFASKSEIDDSFEKSSPTPQAYQSIKFVKPTNSGELTAKSISIFKRILKERTNRDFFKGTNRQLTIDLAIEPQLLPSEAFKIERLEGNIIKVTGGDENGILYGIGKLLHSASSNSTGFIPGDWQGTSIPDKPFRAIYFATHFYNFYQAAPIEKVTNYLEELALWGYNGIHVWFDMHHYTGINDPEAQSMIDRLSLILKAGKAVGMKPGISMLANEAYKTSPIELRADPNTSSGYHYHVEICPSLPGGSELILEQINEELDAFIERGVILDRICLWPYDQGGCGCALCAPWGSNGYLKITKKLSALINKKLPKTEIILSTWLFDFRERDLGEWSGLATAFREEKPWVDYIMADSHTSYPKYLLENPVPGNLPLLNFPEISMWGNWPWGGFGANPFPNRLQNLWNSVADKVAGGYPYSEGIFEDINKIVYSQFYWNREKSASESLREYVSYEFSHEFVDEIVRAVEILEKNYGMSAGKWATIPGNPKVVEISSKDFGAKEAYDILKTVDEKLPNYNKRAWRWRLLLLRALLDYELRLNNGVPNNKINDAFKEICDIQYLEDGDMYVRPPVNFGELYPIKPGEHGRTPTVF